MVRHVLPETAGRAPHKCPTVLLCRFRPDATTSVLSTAGYVLRTFRDGLAAQAGHDLTIEVSRWSGELAVGDDLAPTSLEVRIDMGSLVVREGTGGVKPLTDRDRREIAVTARKVLAADRHPEATFTAADFTAAAGGGGDRRDADPGRAVAALRLQVSESGPAATGRRLGGADPSSGSSRTPGSWARSRSATPWSVRAEVALPDGGATA